jgi:hypothetical protein
MCLGVFVASDSQLALVPWDSQGPLRQASEAGPVEVFVCWEGDYAVTPQVQGERAISSLADEDDWLQELTFTRIAGARER